VIEPIIEPEENKKLVYSWKDTENCVTKEHKLKYLLKRYEEYDDESKIKADIEIKELTIHVNRMKAIESGEVEISNSENAEESDSEIVIEAPIVLKKEKIKKLKEYKPRATKKDKIITEDNFEL
jgi:hypothetical protein